MTFQEIRKTKFRTAKDFAQAINVPTPRVQKWENGSSAPRREDWSKVAKALSVSVEQLLNCFEK